MRKFLHIDILSLNHVHARESKVRREGEQESAGEITMQDHAATPRLRRSRDGRSDAHKSTSVITSPSTEAP